MNVLLGIMEVQRVYMLEKNMGYGYIPKVENELIWNCFSFWDFLLLFFIIDKPKKVM